MNKDVHVHCFWAVTFLQIVQNIWVEIATFLLSVHIALIEK